ncbi:BNR repeat-containing protein, partial [bacterium]|nr:BNR repeat-containing protein [bacterium]
RTYLFWRGGDGRPTVSFSDDEGSTWEKAANLIYSEGVRPYMKIVSDGYETIHIAFTNGHPRHDPTNSLYYCCYTDSTFYRADGTHIIDFEDIPLFPKDADRVYDARADSVRAWVWDIALDAYDRPVIAYTNFPRVTDHRYRYARWNGSSWDDHEICAAGGWTVDANPEKYTIRAELWYSGGIALDHEDPSIVYLSRPVNGIFEIERWQTPDGGATWTREPVTCGSSSHNIRPIVPRGHTPDGPDVLWLHGDYIHYTDFQTSVRMRVPTGMRTRSPHGPLDRTEP